MKNEARGDSTKRDAAGAQAVKLGEVLRKWRLMCEYDLRYAGHQMGLSAATLLRVEQGRDCDSRTLAKILAFLLSAPGTPHRETKA